MATFHIYQDLEKENHQLVPIKGAGKTEFGEQRKEMRSRGGALADLPVNSDVGVPVKTAKDKQEKHEKFEMFDNFEVKAEPPSEQPKEKNVGLADLHAPTHRDHQAIGMVSTPTSATKDTTATPMSIDKSLAEDSRVLRHDRDRFYEVVEYQVDILSYLKEAEVKYRARSQYMKKQPDINDSMRSILVDWLVEVSEEYRLQSETLCLAVNYIDRFLSYMSVVRAKLQLVGTAAIYIAAKYEEIYPPEIGEFVYITDDTYTKVQVLRMEKLLLKVLSFDLCAPTTLTYLNLYAAMLNVPDQIKFLAQYFCELSLLQALPYLRYTPSLLSAAAIALARYTCGQPMWPKKLEETLGYSLVQLQELVVLLGETHAAAPGLPQQAIQDKYKAGKYQQVATVTPRVITQVMFEAEDRHADLRPDMNTTAENIECVRQKTSTLLF